jgi:hypothetical protein
MLFAATPIFAGANTDLGDALETHLWTYRGATPYGLGHVHTTWPNALRERAQGTKDAKLLSLTDEIKALLTNPTAAGSDFRDRFDKLYEEAGKCAYPMAWALKSERERLAGFSTDYTLDHIDLGMVREMEDEALADPVMNEFIGEMRARWSELAKKDYHQVLPAVFEVYSEALVYRMLKQRGGARLSIKKIKETGVPGPDFECKLQVEQKGEPYELTFYIEVKSLDITHAEQRLPEILDDGLNAHVDLEAQLKSGKRIAFTETEIAPMQPYVAKKAPPGGRAAIPESKRYDPHSLRKLIESIVEKAANNFKEAQFKRGPTFALANVLRLPLLGQGPNGLAALFYENSSGVCVSGVLWHLAFGTVGAPVHRIPDFEGKPTLDGMLERDGLLADPNMKLPAAGMMILQHDQGAYRIDGLYDPRWSDQAHNWSDTETLEVFSLLCDGYNDSGNGCGYRYAKGR